jgi:hypothetical protein
MFGVLGRARACEPNRVEDHEIEAFVADDLSDAIDLVNQPAIATDVPHVGHGCAEQAFEAIPMGGRVEFPIEEPDANPAIRERPADA